MPKVRKADIPIFSAGQLEALANVLVDTETGLTGSEIGHHLRQAGLLDTDPDITKRHRLYNAFVHRHNQDRNGNGILGFIRSVMDPARYAGNRALFEARCEGINVPLLLSGLEFRDDGRFHRASRAVTLSEAEERANRLKKKLEDRGVHADVLHYCRAELVADNYFHAVLEAAKSVSEKVRQLTGAEGDGAQLFQDVLGGASPKLKINSFATETERGEQRGFVNLLIGLFGVFRNPTAHVPRPAWPMSEHDALDLLVLASYAHRRLDGGAGVDRRYDR
jgi:uncharacterized protein (TIGR02391 family)